ncbi:hypothetical protein EYR40_006183 [Pleurotus pulmonarius]|nr:hypothetical protein EYR36_010807 [Pleurotus pulmonarius]KAF4599094.1 hypothetical protein EYR40_006183 [Pleurotus pulmonarius]
MQSIFTTEARASSSMELPPLASTRTHTTPSNPVGDFSGNARASRHDRRLSMSSFDGEAPPSYQDVEALPLPSYSERGHKEPVTLAMYLFKFGFLFPPFWILGACILMSELQTPEAPSFDEPEHLAWLPDKTQAERDAIVQEMRRVELKWARRCLAASIIICTLLLVGGLLIWAVLRQ